jgi:hypothetical protein
VVLVTQAVPFQYWPEGHEPVLIVWQYPVVLPGGTYHA